MRRFLIPIYLVCCCVGLALAAARAFAVTYTTSIAVQGGGDLEEALTRQSLLKALQDDHPHSLDALRRRTEQDVKTFHEMLRGYGYFDPEIKYALTGGEENTAASITVDPGPVYTVRRYRVEWLGDEAKALNASYFRAVQKGTITPPNRKSVTPDALELTEQQAMELALRRGFPYPKVTKREMVVDHDKRQVAVTIGIDPGPGAVFGAVHLSGMDSVDEIFLRRRVAFLPGEDFDIRKIDQTRQDIQDSGVIGKVTIEYDRDKAETIADGRLMVPVYIKVTETDPHSVGAGAFYSSSTGASTELFWEDRNMFGQAEKLRLSLELGSQTYGAKAELNKPDLFGRRDLSLTTGAEYSFEELEAYDRAVIGVNGAVNWQVNPRLTLSAGTGLERSEVEEPGEEKETFTLLSFPLNGKFDNTDDLLDPTRGVRLSLGFIPTQELEEQNSFITTEAAASAYWKLNDWLVWANRAKLSQITGQNTDDIPADRRLYAGGGGSVRGYGFQMLGPLDEDGKPEGGRFLAELGTEARIRLTDTIGMAGFFEGGRLSDETKFSAGEPFRWSAGLGGRYYTAVGPIRFDVAVPLNKREEDDSYQIYISLGQAF